MFLSGLPRSARRFFLGDYPDLLEMYDDAEDMFEAAQTIQEPGLREVALKFILGRIRDLEQQSLHEDNEILVDMTRSLKNSVGKFRSSIESPEPYAAEPEWFQTLIIGKLMRSFANLKYRFTRTGEAAGMKDAKNRLRIQTFNNWVQRKTQEIGRTLSKMERSNILRSLPRPSKEDLDKFRSQISLMMLDQSRKQIRDRIEKLSKTNSYEAAVQQAEFEATERRKNW